MSKAKENEISLIKDLCEKHGYPTPPLHEFSLDQLVKIREGALVNLDVSSMQKRRIAHLKWNRYNAG